LGKLARETVSFCLRPIPVCRSAETPRLRLPSFLACAGPVEEKDEVWVVLKAGSRKAGGGTLARVADDVKTLRRTDALEQCIEAMMMMW